MIGWLWRMIVGSFRVTPAHQHEWGILRRVNVFENDGSNRPFRTDYELQCKGCGDIRRRKG